MLWCLIVQIVTVILDVLRLRLVTDLDKDLELLVLRQQIRILERRVGKPVRPSRVEKLLLALTAMQIKDRARTGRQGFKNSLLMFKPAMYCGVPNSGDVRVYALFNQVGTIAFTVTKSELAAGVQKPATPYLIKSGKGAELWRLQDGSLRIMLGTYVFDWPGC